MYVCICNKVTDGQIRTACAEGACSVDCLRDRLHLGTGCGRCRDCARSILDENLLATGAASLATAAAGA